MRRKVGEARIKLAERLREFGLAVEGSDIMIPEGAWRRREFDVARWSCAATWVANPKGLKDRYGREPYIGSTTNILSYDRVVLCAKQGVELPPDNDRGWYSIEACAKGES